MNIVHNLCFNSIGKHYLKLNLLPFFPFSLSPNDIFQFFNKFSTLFFVSFEQVTKE
jgi:hypothetical protein